MHRLLLIVTISLYLVSSVCEADSYCFKGPPHCPWNNQGNTWVGYLTGKYGDRVRGFSIKFDQIKAPISTPYGSLAPNASYTVNFQDGRWRTVGRDNEGGNGEPDFGGADPRQYLMNIRGRIMKFNEAGQVFDRQSGLLVGTLKCGIGPGC